MLFARTEAMNCTTKMMPDSAPSALPPADLKHTVRKRTGESLRHNVLAGNLGAMESQLQHLLALCRDSQGGDRKVLMKCLQRAELLGFPVVVPRRRCVLTIREMLRMLELGFRLGKVDERFEIKLSGGRRVPYYGGREIPEAKWDSPRMCVLKHNACTALLQSFREAQLHAHDALRPTQANRRVNAKRSRKIKEELEEMMFDFKVPTRFDLASPPLLKPDASSLVSRERKTQHSALPASAKHALALQQEGKLPSLLNPETQQALGAVKHTVVILLDVSASTFEREIFKMANLGCAALLNTLKQRLPKVSVSIIPYSDSAQHSQLEMDNFLSPGGTTAYDAAFETAQGLLEKAKGLRSVIHLTDGLPNSLDDAQAAAQRFQALHIQYGQLIFGHTKRVSDLADYLQVEAVAVPGTEREPTRYERYIRCFTSVAEACRGVQTVLWVMKELPDSLFSLMDLVLGCGFLDHHPEYRHLQTSVPAAA